MGPKVLKEDHITQYAEVVAILTWRYAWWTVAKEVRMNKD